MKFLAMLFLTCIASHGLADTTLIFDDGGSVLISKGRVLFGDDESGFLYPGSGDAMKAIDWRDKSYMVIDKDFTSDLSDQMDAAMAQMEAQLAQLPPEQREMMREMLKDKMPALTGSAQQQRSYRKTGKTREIAGFKCREGQVLLNGSPEHETCIASPKEIGMPDEDYAALRNAFKAMANIAKEFRQASDMMFDLEEMEGIPVSSRQLANGEEEDRLVSVSTAKIAAERLTVPADFVEKNPRGGM